MNPTIRPEQEEDHAAVQRVNEEAFGGQTEAKLVNRLRVVAPGFISLVAEWEGEIVGHILFTHIRLEEEARDGEAPPVGDAEPPAIMGLAPMAVLPGFQGRGVGQALVRAGLDACRKRGVGAVIVLGHADFYPRFGFQPASNFGLSCEYEVPDEVFMALELLPGYLAEHRGQVRYHPVFNEP